MGVRTVESTVVLPNGDKAIQVEEIHSGGMETYGIFSYYTSPLRTTEIDKKQFETDYWGQIEGLK
jgi:hypothetical protein